jgi:hypothetical protein
MDIDIQEMRGDALAVDLQLLKSEIIVEIMRRIEQDGRLEQRQREERSLRTSALARPQDIV